MAENTESIRRDEADIPVLHVTGQTLPEAWEEAVIAVWENGAEVRTEYDEEGQSPSLDATVMVEVEAPMDEPRLHKNIPGGPMELEVYRQEVVEGIHDHWINPEEGKWTYTYHERLFAYAPVEDLQTREIEPPFDPVNQIDYIVDKLSEAPYSRRAQAITWMPQADPATYDPPCLQRLWARLLPQEEGYRLNFNAHWRSRDLLMAWFMNVFALTDLQSIIAERLSDALGENVECGRYVDVSDSLHIYGQYRNDKWENEVQKMRDSSYVERSWHSEKFEPLFEEARARLAEDPDYYAKGDDV